MAIQFSKNITNIDVVNSGDKDIVSRVELEFTSYDDSNQEGTTIQSSESFELETDGRSSSSEGWVAYASLDAATVEGWLGSELTDRIASVQANHNGWINSVLTPPAPATVDKALPW
jgi:hypothetical protein|tara:strand:- start:243 stop:590 length:348 start_codon:yes stop_codon:yes gene_type:complete